MQFSHPAGFNIFKTIFLYTQSHQDQMVSVRLLLYYLLTSRNVRTLKHKFLSEFKLRFTKVE